MKNKILSGFFLMFLSFGAFAQTYNMTAGNVTACSGTFYDNGGNLGTYGNNLNLTFTICPSTPGSKVTVNFTTFNLENNFDFLTVYDGPTTASPSLGSYTGTAGPGLASASPTNTSGCLTFVFTSDGSVANAGWAGTIACTTPCTTPTANIVSTTPAAVGGIIRICQGGTVSFNGTITGGNGGVDTYAWNLGNGTNSTLANPTATYPTAGSYQVNLNGTEGGCPNTNSAAVTVQVSTTPTFTSTATPPTICLGQSSNLAATVTMNPFTPNCTPPISGTTFLPDGSGVSYTTAINVNCFNQAQTITSAANFSNLCLSLEHSYLGDLQITLICPNGQSMILKSYAAGGAGTYLGSPLDDPTVGPGTGYVYCFTPTATTQLVAGPTVTAGVPAGPSIAAGNYAPEQPFTNMIGCPLNGAWTIQVTDNLASDNGYIFNWDVNFTVPAATGGFTPTIATQGWNPTAGLTGTGATTATVTPTATGNQCYTYSMTDNFGCTYTQNQCITVNPNTPVNAGPDLSACPGQTLTIGGTPTGAAGTSYSWAETLNNAQIAIAGSTTIANPSVTLSPTATGSVQYTVTGTSGGCTTTDVMTINVTAPPTVTVNSPSICAGNATVTATPSPAGTYNYAWTVPAGATNPGNVASFSTPVSGQYSVIITSSAGCSSTSVSGTVTLNPAPTVSVNSPNVCASSATVTATPSPGGTYSYVWTVPSGAANPGNVASFSATTSGTYSVIITNTITGCSSISASGVITINPNPSVTVNSPSICSGNTTVTATPSPTGTYNYAWTVPAGATNPGNVASFSTAVSGTYSVIITNSTTGCSSTSSSGTVTVSPLPTVAVNSPTVCGTSAIVTATPTPAGTYSYAWTVPSGAANPGNVASFSATISGTYSVIITNTTTGCSSIAASGVVTINPNPSVTVNSPSICAGNATVTATPSPAGTYNYAWTVPAGATNPGNVASFSTAVSGTYSVIITNSTTGCSSTSSSGTVTVSPLPTVTVNSPTICGTTATVTATPAPAGTYSYAWTVPTGAPNPGNVASFSATVSGTYSVIITNTTTGCLSTSASGIVTINPVPTVTVNSPSSCGGSVTVTATPSSAGIYDYAWTVPAGVTNPGNVASFSATTSGNYSVIITNPTTGCSSTSAIGTVTINVVPTVTVNNPTICGTTATVTATPTPAGTYTYAWTVPTGATNPGNVASFSATVSGSYSVIITNTITGCLSSSASGIATINPVPTVTVNSPSACQNGQVTLTATPNPAGVYDYAWTVPTGVTNPGNVASFNSSTAGTYAVIITDPTTNCSSTSASGTVTINQNPSVVVNNPSICSGANATVIATPSPAGTYNYAWTVPSGATNPGNVTTFSTGTAGTYDVVITNSSTGCFSVTGSGTVSTNANPTVTVNDEVICQNNIATLVATPAPAGTYSYAWTVPSGAINPGNLATFNTSTAGTYSVIITNTATGCSSVSVSGIVTVNSNPTVTVNSPSACDGFSATVTATPSPAGTYDYAWTVPVLATNPGNVASFSTAQAGSYSVIITNSITGCSSNSNGGVVTINLNPTVLVNNPITCTDIPTLMAATPSPAGTYTYSWTVPAGVSNPGSTATFNSAVAGTYSVVITNPITGCVSASSPGVLTVNANPQPIFISDVTEGCVPLTVNFINQTPNADDCVWSINNGVQLTGCDTVTYTFVQPGCYDVTLTTTSNNGCTGSSTITNMICVEDLPNASFVAQNNPVSTLEPIIPFINTSTGATSYVWDFGDSSSLSYEIDPTHTYGSFEATYLVTLIAISDAGCVDTTTVPVQVQEELIYYIPNSFSPDADPFNNVFEPIFSSGFDPKGYTLLIFDRWGEILFESHNTEVGWDGTYNGSVVQDGTYIWKIEFKLSNNDGKVMDTGHVNLIR
jgi:gliding motility-associated-like protein